MIPKLRRIIAATHNRGKAREIATILGQSWVVATLDDFPAIPEPDEHGVTFQENADIKALEISRRLKDLGVLEPNDYILADDSGLEVDLLGGAPGVYSARYSGVSDPALRDAANNKKLLSALKEILQGVPEEEQASLRGAQFHTVLSLAKEGKIITHFEAVQRGSIAGASRGENGFAYDTVFVPEGHGRTFGEMSAEEKNAMSMRAQTLAQLGKWAVASLSGAGRLAEFGQLGATPSKPDLARMAVSPAKSAERRA